MKNTLLALTLLSLAPLGTGCEAPPSAPKAENKVKGDDKPRPVPPSPATLTSAMPAVPRSVADTPTPPRALPKPEEKAAEETKPAEVATTEEAPKLDSAKEKDATDYDRPLSPSEVRIERFVLATGVEAREPVDVRDVFPVDTPKIFAFVHFDNEHGDPYALRVHWEKVDGPASPYGFKLTVPTAKRHRTWSWTAIRREPGHYRAVLRTLDGQEVASREFTLE